MELEILRTYYPKGTNGSLYINGSLQCHSIELPWLNNQHQVSCIPEGRYVLEKRYSPKLGHVLEIKEVENRKDILIHPANDAILELKGCIAPVTTLTGDGKGSESRAAFLKIKTMVYTAIETEHVFLTIKTKHYDNHSKGAITYTKVL